MPGSRRLADRWLGDERAVRSVYEAHGGELYRFALSALDDAGAAEEVVQETFVRAWRNSDRFDPEIASLRTWLFAIARNVVIDMARARAVRPLPPVPESRGTPEVAGDHAEEVLRAWQVEEALSRLSPQHRQAIVETYYRQRPYAEVAAEAGVPVGTLRSRVFYGLKSLRVVLEELGWGQDG